MHAQQVAVQALSPIFLCNLPLIIPSSLFSLFPPSLSLPLPFNNNNNIPLTTPYTTHNLRMPSLRAMVAHSLMMMVRLRPLGWLILANMMPRKIASSSTARMHWMPTSHAGSQQSPMACEP